MMNMNKFICHLFIPNIEDEFSLNEDLKTFGHNLWTRGVGIGPHAFNIKRLAVLPLPSSMVGFLSNLFNGTDKVDYGYFKSMYNITDRVRSRLLSILRSYKDAVVVGKNGIQGGTNAHFLNFNGKSSGLASRHMRQATAGFGGITTTATCFYKLPTKGGYYILYFTFDGTGIKNCQVLCKKPGANNEEYDSYYTRKIPEFDRIPESEYKKQ